MGFVIGPIMRSLSVPARIELTKRLMPKMLLIMPTLVTMTLAAGFQLARPNGMLNTAYERHGWVVASMVVVAVMAMIALALLQPANVAVLFELRKPQPNPGDRATADAPLHLRRRDHRRDAGRDARDHDEASDVISLSLRTPARRSPSSGCSRSVS